MALRCTPALCFFLAAAPHAAAQVWETNPLVQDFPENGLGFVVETAGDVDQDGKEDCLISAINAMGNRGRVYVISSSGSGTLHTVTGTLQGDNLGHSTASPGDVDGDGISDFAAGAPVLSGIRAGYVTVYSGATGQPLWTQTGESVGDAFGWVIAAAGDVNADGIPDLIVGAPGHDQPAADAGKAYVYSGLDGTLIDSWEGLAAGDSLGSAVGSAGDQDQDGHSEVLLCAFRGGPNNRGAAYVHSGADGTLQHTVQSPPAGTNYGNYFGGLAGDINADGTPDFYVLDYSHSGQRGRLYVYSGTDASLIHAIRGPVGNVFLFGRVNCGDLNGDGHDDLLLCTGGNASGAPAGAGAVFLYSGQTGESLGRYTGSIANQAMGTDCAAIGDVDGDGREDILVGVARENGNGNGGIFVLSTKTLPPVPVCFSNANSTGAEAELGYRGSLSLAASELELDLTSAPAQVSTLLYGGPSATQVPFGDGVRCIAAPVVRLVAGTSDTAGNQTYAPTWPTTGAAGVLVGQPWYVQSWYRDPAAGASGFNFSSALVLNFLP